MITVVTAFTKHYTYGLTFLERFFQYFPREVNLIVYVEEPVELEWGECRLIQDVPGYTDFMERNNTPLYTGQMPVDIWEAKARRYEYSYKHDACKFAIQGFSPLYAAEGLEGHMIWLDADVFAYKPVTKEFLEKLLDGDVTFLGRRKAHSELGFVGYKLPESLPVLQAFYDYYNTDGFQKLKEWHSAYIFDRSLDQCDVNKCNLTPKGSGHVWFQSPLGLCLDHCKGRRKDIGFSKEVKKLDFEEMFPEFATTLLGGKNAKNDEM